jgi:hypothetical protein
VDSERIAFDGVQHSSPVHRLPHRQPQVVVAIMLMLDAAENRESWPGWIG